jgi:hypothetical protein
VFRKEKRARKADSDAENVGQVIGKDISPYDYDGRPHSWWKEPGGNGGQRAAGTASAAAEVGREMQADGKRRVPATTGTGDREWDSVVVEDSDVAACQGLLPERCTGIAGESEAPAIVDDDVSSCETETSSLDDAGRRETSINAGCAAPVTQEDREVATDRGPVEEFAPDSGEGETSEKAPNEPNCRDDVCIAEHQDAIEVPANSHDSSGLDNIKTNPNVLRNEANSGGRSGAGQKWRIEEWRNSRLR